MCKLPSDHIAGQGGAGFGSERSHSESCSLHHHTVLPATPKAMLKHIGWRGRNPGTEKGRDWPKGRVANSAASGLEPWSGSLTSEKKE